MGRNNSVAHLVPEVWGYGESLPDVLRLADHVAYLSGSSNQAYAVVKGQIELEISTEPNRNDQVKILWIFWYVQKHV